MKELTAMRARAGMLIGLSLVLALCASRAQAQNAGGGGEGGEAPQEAGRPGADLGGLLGLTPEQIARIQSIREQNKEERQALNQRLRRAQSALDEAIYSENADQAAVEQRARELSEAQAAATRMRALTELSIRRVLTPEQLATLQQIRARARAEHMGRRLENGANGPRNPNFSLDRGLNRPAAPGQRERRGSRPRRP
ncbi:MAG TPA: Spy/CpxP family protein refolding chaperone [Pyrinomonadaceae bacterium]|jgi:Spy/CpxP family protein refolding chaperone